VEPALAERLLQQAADATKEAYAQLQLIEIKADAEIKVDAKKGQHPQLFRHFEDPRAGKKLALSATEFISLIDVQPWRREDIMQLTIEDIVTLSTFKHLTKTFNDTQDQLIGICQPVRTQPGTDHRVTWPRSRDRPSFW
jgi:hypothetical protein